MNPFKQSLKFSWLFFLLLTCNFQFPTFLYAEDVSITTYYPSPSASYKQLQVQNQDESTTPADFTQGLLKSGINIITDYTNNAYTPGIFWSTVNDNSTKPKAGIWMLEATTGTKLLFGTSNNYAVGLNATPGLTIDIDGDIGINTTSPDSSAKLDVTATTKGFLPPRLTDNQMNAVNQPATGLLVFNTDQNKYYFNSGTPGAPNWIPMSGTSGTVACTNLVNTGPSVSNTGNFAVNLVVNGKNICEDDTGCTYRIWAYDGTHPAGFKFRGTLPAMFHQVLNTSNTTHPWRAAFADGITSNDYSTGTNGNGTADNLFSSASGAWSGSSLHDGDGANDVSPDQVTFVDGSATYAYYVQFCDI